MARQDERVTVKKFTEREGWVKCIAVFAAGSTNQELWDALRKHLALLQTRYGSFDRRQLDQTPHWLVFFTHHWPEKLIDELFGQVAKSLGCELNMQASTLVGSATTQILIVFFRED